MKEVKFLGKQRRGNDKQNYNYSIFICSLCGNEVIRKTKDGINQKYCSHSCYAKDRSPRGAYNAHTIISGYKYIYNPTHPNATKLGYVAEHRMVAEEKVGRILKDNEVVHHINGDKNDNRHENLEILTESEHNKLHALVRKRDGNGKFTL